MDINGLGSFFFNVVVPILIYGLTQIIKLRITENAVAERFLLSDLAIVGTIMLINGSRFLLTYTEMEITIQLMIMAVFTLFNPVSIYLESIVAIVGRMSQRTNRSLVIFNVLITIALGSILNQFTLNKIIPIVFGASGGIFLIFYNRREIRRIRG